MLRADRRERSTLWFNTWGEVGHAKLDETNNLKCEELLDEVKWEDSQLVVFKLSSEDNGGNEGVPEYRVVMKAYKPPPFRWHYADLDDTNASAYQLRGRTLFFVVILFAIILLASLLFFYARWVCRSPPSNSHRNPDAAAAAAGGVGRRRRGLDAAVVSALPVLLYGSQIVRSNGKKKTESGAEEGAECCICLSVFEEEDEIKFLPDCNHCFHSDCVDRWLLTQSTCPLCRSSLRFHQSADTQIVIH
uniref:RING-type E3 ubiquitin transferase n=1 Tax=Kalanchoe fedtschenkoi TaxID=63787 RepID=A0A7N0RIT6_KALFE